MPSKQQSKIPKGLPKRVGNENRKRRRAESWARGQERKRKIREQDELNRLAKLNKAAE